LSAVELYIVVPTAVAVAVLSLVTYLVKRRRRKP